jgi:hypothetical protein
LDDQSRAFRKGTLLPAIPYDYGGVQDMDNVTNIVAARFHFQVIVTLDALFHGAGVDSPSFFLLFTGIPLHCKNLSLLRSLCSSKKHGNVSWSKVNKPFPKSRLTFLR